MSGGIDLAHALNRPFASGSSSRSQRNWWLWMSPGVRGTLRRYTEQRLPTSSKGCGSKPPVSTWTMTMWRERASLRAVRLRGRGASGADSCAACPFRRVPTGHGDAGRPHRHRRYAFIDLRRQPWPCVPARPHPHRSFHCIPSRPVRRARAWLQGPQAWVG